MNEQEHEQEHERVETSGATVPGRGDPGVLAENLHHSAVLASLSPSTAGEAPHVLPLGHSHGPTTGGIYLVSYAMDSGGPGTPGSAILKVLSSAGLDPQESQNVESYLYWEREALAYTSGLLDDLPGGLRAPRLLGTEARGDGSLWLWLERLEDRYGPRWPLSQYRHAARVLGRFNGAYLVERPLPPYPWLNRMGSARGLLDGHAWLRDVVVQPLVWEHPWLRASGTAGMAGRLGRLWDERAPLLDRLDGLPHTLCHLDAWKANLYALPDGDGRHTLAAVDWASVGRGSIGTDPGDLFAPSFMHGLVAPCTPRELDEAIYLGYLEGLAAAGWRGDPAVVRFGYTAFTALKYGGVFPWLLLKDEAGSVEAWARGSGRPPAVLLHEPVALMSYLLDLLDEARTLADGLF